MKIEKIEYLEKPQDLLNACIDVIISLRDEYCDEEFAYVVECTTPQHLSNLMKKDKSDFVAPHYPYIIVSKLTHEVIENALQAFIDDKEDSYWLKSYHLIGILEIDDVNELLKRKKKQLIELRAEIAAEVEAEMAAELAPETEVEKDKDRND